MSGNAVQRKKCQCGKFKRLVHGTLHGQPRKYWACRACDKVRSHKLYLENKTKRLKQQHAWVKANPDKLAGYRKKRTAKMRAYMKKYTKKNKERILARGREWYAKNKEKRRKSITAWQEKNKEYYKLICRAASRRWYWENADHCRKLWRLRYRKDPERYTRERLSWSHKNRHLDRANWARRGARERGAEGFHTAMDIQRIMQRQRGLCANHKCAKDISQKYSIDHRKPLSRGGSNYPRNLQLLCKSCNSSKRDRTMKEWMAAL